MVSYNGIGIEIIEGGIFERFPKLIPFEGPYYDKNKNHSKLLLIGESNYFRNELESISDFKVAEKWYHGVEPRLIPDEMIDKVNNGGKIEYLKGLKSTIHKLLNTDPYFEIAFYNYFLRPASEKVKKGGKIDWGFKNDYTDLDGEVAFAAFCGILKSIQPDIVIFASALAWGKMEFFKKKQNKDFGKIVIKQVSHPSSPWWNRNNGANGRQLFENLLTKHWITKFQKLQTIHSVMKEKFNVGEGQECFFDEKGNYLSCLYFKIKDSSFCCETGVKINGVDFWTCFYKTDNSKAIPAIEDKKYDFTPNISNDIIVVVEEIEKVINQIIKEIETS